MSENSATKIISIEQAGSLCDPACPHTLTSEYSMKTPSDVTFWTSLYNERKERFEREFADFLSFKSISADPTCRSELAKCAEWVMDRYRESGFAVTSWPTARGAPVVIARSPFVPGAPTLLLYNHYDVQPVDPLELWNHDPFTAHIEGDKVVARGAQDNKGQCFYVMCALRMMQEQCKKLKYKTLPLNVIHLIEGEEESGSVELFSLLEQHKEEIQADYLLIVDVGMPARDTPAITLGARGLVTFRIEAVGSATDLHSGSHGGLAYNPLRALVELLGKLQDPTSGRVSIPGFYDDIARLSPEEQRALSMRFCQESYTATTGAEPTGGEKGYTPCERRWLRPTFEINGIQGGYTGPGFKTVIPARATAHISCRLVPDQTPEIIAQRVKEYLLASVPRGITLTVDIHSGMGLPSRSSPHSPLIDALKAACLAVFGKSPELILDGASIPITASLAKASGASCAMFGLGLDSDKIHAPNEEFDFTRLRQGTLAIIEMCSSTIIFKATENL